MAKTKTKERECPEGYRYGYDWGGVSIKTCVVCNLYKECGDEYDRLTDKSKTKHRAQYDKDEERELDDGPNRFDPDSWLKEWDKTKSTNFITHFGNWIPLSKILIKFMGLQNTIFYVGLIDLYNHFRKSRRVKKGVLFYSAAKFERDWDISYYHQRKAIKQLTKLGLLKTIEGKTRSNERKIKINLYGFHCIIQLINEVIDKDELPILFKKLLSKTEKYKKLRLTMRKGLVKKLKYEEFAKSFNKLWTSMSS